jgi:hypothetical protein
MTKKMRHFAAYCAFVATICYLIIMFAVLSVGNGVNHGDFIQYWAAGQQLAHRANPYDPTALLRLEQAVGQKDNTPLVTFSPPVILFLVWPLGFLSPKAAVIVWLLLLLVSLSVSLRILWILNGRREDHLELCGYLFAPALACFLSGQLGIFLLLGIVLFLYLYESSPYFAGAALLPCTFKPHLFLPFGIVLLLWLINCKAYRILVGFSAILVLVCAFPLFFDVHVWSQYAQMMSTTGVLHRFLPTLSVAFRSLIDWEAVWLQFIPEVTACIWALWYFWKQGTRWNWMNQGLFVLLISALCTPYGWFVDETVLLPAVLAGVYRAVGSRRSLMPIGLVGAGVLIEFLVVPQMNSRFYLWTVPTWLVWYIYATRNESTHVDGIRSTAEQTTFMPSS